MRVVIVGALPESLLNFRGELLADLVSEGHEVIALANKAAPSVIAGLGNLGVSFYSFPVQRNGMNPLEDVKTFFALRKHFQNLKPDVVMAYTIKPVIWGGLALRSMPNIRFYALITGLGFAFHATGSLRKLLTRVVIALYRLALARASQVIFQNSDNRNEFVKRKILPDSRCSTIDGSGVNLSRFKQSSQPEQECVFLVLSRLLGDKGLREYASAACLVRKRFPEVMFKLVGPEDSSPDSIPLVEVQSWQEQGWVDYYGATDDVKPFLNECSVFVLPSYHEGMPRTVLEAMSVGRPILTTDAPGCRETVVPGENGFLVAKADAKALAERMIWFIENRDKWKTMGIRSRQIAEERFDVRKVNSKLMSILGLKG
jgi:glycosyltransferase involved in cell wall biosynthesis